MEKIKLRPCPFCGSLKIEIIEFIERNFFVKCDHCEIYMLQVRQQPGLFVSFSSPYEAACAWNKREK